jgi:4-hydroxybenzoate polyprenyltransferase/phosphoserine phosphatase
MADAPDRTAPDRTAPDRTALVVDLDGTLTPADVSLESFLAFARSSFGNALLLLVWLIRSRSFAKMMVARRLPLDAAALPIRASVQTLIDQARSKGRPVILASGSHIRNVRRVAQAHGPFDHVIGTTGKSNLKGSAKLARLRAHLGDGAFDTVGDAAVDVPLWRAARHRYTTRYIAPGLGLVALENHPSLWRTLARTLRVHQWAKNILVFVPVATAGLLLDPTALARAALLFALFSALASGIYQFNDLLDIDADRQHATKRTRPIASGAVSIPLALLLGTALTIVPLALAAALLGPATFAVLVSYAILTTAYSLRLKSVMTLDVITLACLYTLRIGAGAVAIGVALSHWLLLFSLFFFLSLGYLKRYTELWHAQDPARLVKGRGYIGADLDLVATSGIATGMVSVLVMALYIADPAVAAVYRTPELLWPLCLVLLYWLNRLWLMARRGEVDGDPVAFAIRDPRSIAIAAAMALCLLAARLIG